MTQLLFDGWFRANQARSIADHAITLRSLLVTQNQIDISDWRRRHKNYRFSLSTFIPVNYINNDSKISTTFSGRITTCLTQQINSILSTTSINMTSTTAAVPVSCCGREGGCVCAKEATCSCGKQSALHCNCEKAQTENVTKGARCSCRESHPPPAHSYLISPARCCSKTVMMS